MLSFDHWDFKISARGSLGEVNFVGFETTLEIIFFPSWNCSWSRIFCNSSLKKVILWNKQLRVFLTKSYKLKMWSVQYLKYYYEILIRFNGSNVELSTRQTYNTNNHFRRQKPLHNWLWFKVIFKQTLDYFSLLSWPV